MKNIERVIVYPLLGMIVLAFALKATPVKNIFSTESEPFTANPNPVQTAAYSKTTTTGLPNYTLTPGSIYSKDDQQICAGQTKNRSVSEKTKSEVYQKYGIFSNEKGQYEIDHLVALQLGGSNNRENLWPMTVQQHALKTKLDNKLKKLVCQQKRLQLVQAQAEVKKDWITAYNKYVVSAPSYQTSPTPQATSQPNSQPVTATKPSFQAITPHEVTENNQRFFVTSEGVKVLVASSVDRPTKETVEAVNLSDRGRQDICDYYDRDFKYLDCDKK